MGCTSSRIYAGPFDQRAARRSDSVVVERCDAKTRKRKITHSMDSAGGVSASILCGGNPKANLDDLNFALLCCHLCKIFQVDDVQTAQSIDIPDFHALLSDIKEWKSCNDVTLSRGITGYIQLPIGEEEGRMPFAVFEMKFVNYEEISRTKLVPFNAADNSKVGRAGAIFATTYDRIRATGIVSWIANAMEGKKELLITGHGMGGALTNLLLADLGVVLYKERLANRLETSVKETPYDEELLEPNTSKQRSDSCHSNFSHYGATVDGDERKPLPFFAVTFGAPRVFASVTVLKLHKLNFQNYIHRFVNKGDPIPLYPGYSAGIDEYRHMGTPIYYEDSANSGAKNQFYFIKALDDVDFDGLEIEGQIDSSIDLKSYGCRTDSSVDSPRLKAHGIDSYLQRLVSVRRLLANSPPEAEDRDKVGDLPQLRHHQEDNWADSSATEPASNGSMIWNPKGVLKYMVSTSSANLYGGH